MSETLIVGIISSLTSFGVAILSYYFKRRLDARNQDKTPSVEDRIRRDNIILRIMNEIRDKHDFDRICLFMFHNGTTYYTGDSMQKLSIAFEVDKPGVSLASTSMQGIPAGLLNRPLTALLNDPIFHADTAIEEDSHFRNMLMSYNVRHQYSIKLEDDIGWNGVLTCSFHTDRTKLDPTELEYIRVQVARISSLMKLTNKYYDWQKRGKIDAC